MHLLHARIFYRAKEFLESRTKYFVVGGFVSPSHDKFVREKSRRTPREAVPALHRVRMCQALLADSSWIDVSTWEATRKCVMDYPSVLRHVHEVRIDLPRSP